MNNSLFADIRRHLTLPAKTAPDNVVVLAPINQFRVAAFKRLVCQLMPLTVAEHMPKLRIIFVLPRANIPEAINFIISHYLPTSQYDYTSGPTGTNAVAFPVETDTEFACYVILADDLVDKITPHIDHPYELVSALVEEMFHVKLYVSAWLRRQVTDELKQQHAWDSDIFVLCKRFHDEYIVNRSKAILVSKYPLLDSGYGIGIGTIFFDGSVAEYLDQAAGQLVGIAQSVAENKESQDIVWRKVCNCCYRYMFEPLARDEAFRKGNSTESPVAFDAHKSSLFREVLENHWITIAEQLDRSYVSNLAETESVLQELANILKLFFHQIGITFVQNEQAKWNLVFAPSYLLSRKWLTSSH